MNLLAGAALAAFVIAPSVASPMSGNAMHASSMSMNTMGMSKMNHAAVHFERLTMNAGVLRTKSAYGMGETVRRLKADIAAKKIMFFDEIDQQKLAANTKIKIGPSILLIFGNPPLGTQFLEANPYSGLDWPVRMLVTQDKNGQVWIAYTDFTWIAHRHHITTRDPQFAMANMVAQSIASAAEPGTN
jgi:uncharacterized protein (DUF302 family)